MTRSRGSKEARQHAALVERWRKMDLFHDALGLDPHIPGPRTRWTPPNITYDDEVCPVVVSLDIELWEFDGSTITEVGIATLDPLLISEVPPQDRGKSWWNYIYAQHIRARETMHMVNSRFVDGCPEAFNFGTSLIVSARSQARMIQELLKAVVHPHRPLCIVGHDPNQDIEHLRRIGVNFESISPKVNVIDTREIYRLLFPQSQGPSLSNLLAGLNIDKANLHNAGNDAVYTLRGALAIAVCMKESDVFAFKNRAMLGWEADAGHRATDLGFHDDDDEEEDYCYSDDGHRYR